MRSTATPAIRCAPARAAAFRSLLTLTEELDSMTEHAREQRLLVAKAAEMRRLTRRLQVAGPFVVAGNGVVGDQRFEFGDCVKRAVEQRAGAPLTVSAHERRWIQFEAGQHLTGVTRAGTAPDAVTLDHRDRCPGARQTPSRGQTRIPAADNGHIN